MNTWMIRKNLINHKYLRKIIWKMWKTWKIKFMKDVTKSDYRYKKRVCINFKIKHLGEYHDLYGQSNTFLLADVFENFWNICIGIFELDPSYFLSAWQPTSVAKAKMYWYLINDRIPIAEAKNIMLLINMKNW